MSRTLLVSALLLLTIGCDQATKAMARENLSARSLSYLGDFFRLSHTENSGAFLSLGAGFQDATRFWIFTVGVGLFTLAALFYLYRKKMPLCSAISLTLIVAGGIGNFIDRAQRGTVTDFLNLGVGPLRTGIFNVADVAITIGVAMMLVNSFKKPSTTV